MFRQLIPEKCLDPDEAILNCSRQVLANLFPSQKIHTSSKEAEDKDDVEDTAK